MRLFRALTRSIVVLGRSSRPAPHRAQAIAGSQLSGVVRDSSGGAIPGAEVTVTKTDTGIDPHRLHGRRRRRTRCRICPSGPYQLKVVLQGFNTYVRDGIVLQVGSNPEINVTLAVGAISEQVTVTANSHAGRDAETPASAR